MDSNAPATPIYTGPDLAAAELPSEISLPGDGEAVLPELPPTPSQGTPQAPDGATPSFLIPQLAATLPSVTWPSPDDPVRYAGVWIFLGTDPNQAPFPQGWQLVFRLALQPGQDATQWMIAQADWIVARAPQLAQRIGFGYFDPGQPSTVGGIIPSQPAELPGVIPASGGGARQGQPETPGTTLPTAGPVVSETATKAYDQALDAIDLQGDALASIINQVYDVADRAMQEQQTLCGAVLKRLEKQLRRRLKGQEKLVADIAAKVNAVAQATVAESDITLQQLQYKLVGLGGDLSAFAPPPTQVPPAGGPLPPSEGDGGVRGLPSPVPQAAVGALAAAPATCPPTEVTCPPFVPIDEFADPQYLLALEIGNQNANEPMYDLPLQKWIATMKRHDWVNTANFATELPNQNEAPAPELNQLV